MSALQEIDRHEWAQWQEIEPGACPICGSAAYWRSDSDGPTCHDGCSREAILRALRDALSEAHDGAKEAELAEFRERERAVFRLVDLYELLKEPPPPTPWRVRGFVADGTVTVLAATSGVGKSIFCAALCAAVEDGRGVGGLEVKQGPALYVDAEMGKEMFARRAWDMTGGQVPPYEYAEALGADLAAADVVAELERRIEQTGAKLVVLDSLKALTPSKDENSNTDMGPVMQAILRVSRNTQASVVVIHHKGASDKAFRGATVIRDQADALFALAKTGEGRFKLWIPEDGKMRYASSPKPMHLAIDMSAGGIAQSDGREEPKRSGRPPTAVLKMRASILAALPIESRSEAARALDMDPKNGTLRRAWDSLIEDDEIERIGDVWKAVPKTSDPVGPTAFGTPGTPMNTADAASGVPDGSDTPPGADLANVGRAGGAE